MAALKKGKCPDCNNGFLNWYGPKTTTQRTLKCKKCGVESIITKSE